MAVGVDNPDTIDSAYSITPTVCDLEHVGLFCFLFRSIDIMMLCPGYPTLTPRHNIKELQVRHVSSQRPEGIERDATG